MKENNTVLRYSIQSKVIVKKPNFYIKCHKIMIKFQEKTNLNHAQNFIKCELDASDCTCIGIFTITKKSHLSFLSRATCQDVHENVEFVVMCILSHHNLSSSPPSTSCGGEKHSWIIPLPPKKLIMLKDVCNHFGDVCYYSHKFSVI